MPCFSDAWDTGLEPGSPEYLQEQERVRLDLDRIHRITRYYCNLHKACLPELEFRGKLEMLSVAQVNLLESIYHHLRCDGINASSIFDIQALIDINCELAPAYSEIAEWCMWLARGSGRAVFDHNYAAANPRKQLLWKFWTELAEELRKKLPEILMTAPAPRNWLATSIQSCIPALNITLESGTNEIAIGLYFSGSAASDHFASLLKNKTSIESSFGFPLEWLKYECAPAFRIACKLPCISIDNTNCWHELQMLIAEHIILMDKVFRPIMQALNEEGSESLVQSFMQAFRNADSAIVFCQKTGYMHIHSPNHPRGLSRCTKHHVVVESNGTVAFSRSLASAMNAEERPQLPISEHPLGYSSGPVFGRFTHALSYDAIISEYRDLNSFAHELVRRASAANLW